MLKKKYLHDYYIIDSLVLARTIMNRESEV